jgi:beta-lactamase class D
MRKRLMSLLLLAAVAASGCAEGLVGGDAAAPAQTAADAPAQKAAPAKTEASSPELAAYFKDRPGTFVLLDLKSGRYLRHDPARAAQRFPPFSTFKIPNSLIGLETGVIKDADFLIKWDEQKYPANPNFPQWFRDQTLRTAFQRSAVWYYQELAERVGEPRMKELVDRLDYGNEDTSGGLTRFWLNSSLKISADEQVEFLKRFYREELPVSKRSLAVVKEIMVHEETPAYRLSGKTGAGPLSEGRFLGWFVGYLEAGGDTHLFAIQLEGPTFASIRDERIRLAKQILADRGLMKQQ